MLYFFQLSTINISTINFTFDSHQKPYYKILGLKHNANNTSIKAAFKNVGKKYHPNKAPKSEHGKEETETRFGEVFKGMFL